jgi:hypothetical protein
MTHLLDTSALLAHYLAEPGASRVQALFEDETVLVEHPSWRSSSLSCACINLDWIT